MHFNSKRIKTSIFASVIATILIGSFVLTDLPQVQAVPSTLWQIGNIANPHVSPQSDGGEFLQNNNHFNTFTYNVDSNDPIDDCNTSGCVNFPAQIGTTNNSGWTATTIAEINFSSELCFSEATLTMYKYGSEDDLVTLNGVSQGEISGGIEGALTISSLSIGPILKGDSTLELEIELGSGNNDKHFVDAILLEIEESDEFECPSLHISKFYDSNVNGVKDSEEPEIADWLVEVAEFQSGSDLITSSSTTLTTAWFDPLEEEVLVSEAQEENWVPTNQNVPPVLITEFVSDASVSISSNTRITIEGETIVEFGNVCLGEGDANSKGFWTNKHGKSLYFDPEDENILNGLNLVDGKGEATDFDNYNEFKSWLKSAKSKNMAYMLSAQLAAMQLNVNHGLDETSLVYAPGAVDGKNFLTIQELMDAANDELGLHPKTKSPSDYRDFQEIIKDALDDANNNLNFVQPEICEPFVALEEPPV